MPKITISKSNLNRTRNLFLLPKFHSEYADHNDNMPTCKRLKSGASSEPPLIISS